MMLVSILLEMEIPEELLKQLEQSHLQLGLQGTPNRALQSKIVRIKDYNFIGKMPHQHFGFTMDSSQTSNHN